MKAKSETESVNDESQHTNTDDEHDIKMKY